MVNNLKYPKRLCRLAMNVKNQQIVDALRWKSGATDQIE
jgi:hypothetical protein